MTIARRLVSAAALHVRVRFLALLSFILVAAVMASCSTTEGFGKDVKSLGGGIEDSAARNK